MVRICHRLGGNGPGLIPIHAGFVNEDPHELGNHQSGMGVVDLNDVLLVEVLQSAVGVQVLGGNGLNGGGNKEVLLLEPQGLALIVVILRVEHLGNGLSHGLFFGGLEVLAAREQGHIHRLGGAGIPQAQSIDVLGVVTGHHHVAGDGHDRGGVFVDDVQVPVIPEFPKGAAEVNSLGFLGLGQQPGGAQILPVIRQLHLLAFHDLLLEDTQFIADGVSVAGISKVVMESR